MLILTSKYVFKTSLFVFMLILTLSKSYATGAQGYFWGQLPNAFPTAQEFIDYDCSLYTGIPSCTGTTIDSTTETQVIYKRQLSNQTSSSPQYLSRTQCQSWNSNHQAIASCDPSYVPITICSDGYPDDALEGYTCDRPPLQTCNDGYILETEFCNQPTPVCTDYDDCFQWMNDNTNCLPTDDIYFTYIDNSNMEFTCSSQAEGEVTPPSIECNGTACYEDPTPIITPVGGDTGGGDTGGGDTGGGDTGGGDTGGGDTGGGNTGGGNTGGGDTGGGNTGGSQEQNQGECDPTSSTYLQCIGNNSGTLNTFSTKTTSDVNQQSYDAIANSELVQSFKAFASIVKLSDTTTCPPFSINFPQPIGRELGTQIHCDLMVTIGPLLSPVMIIVYLFTAFRIFASS